MSAGTTSDYATREMRQGEILQRGRFFLCSRVQDEHARWMKGIDLTCEYPLAERILFTFIGLGLAAGLLIAQMTQLQAGDHYHFIQLKLSENMTVSSATLFMSLMLISINLMPYSNDLAKHLARERVRLGIREGMKHLASPSLRRAFENHPRRIYSTPLPVDIPEDGLTSTTAAVSSLFVAMSSLLGTIMCILFICTFLCGAFPDAMNNAVSYWFCVMLLVAGLFAVPYWIQRVRQRLEEDFSKEKICERFWNHDIFGIGWEEMVALSGCGK